MEKHLLVLHQAYFFLFVGFCMFNFKKLFLALLSTFLSLNLLQIIYEVQVWTQILPLQNISLSFLKII